MSVAAAPSRVALYGRAQSRSSSAEGPVLLVVGNRDLNHLAMHFVASRPGARSHRCEQAHVLNVVRSTAIDLILLDVDASLMAGFVLAAHIRAADRGRNDGKSATIVATTSCQFKFGEFHAGGSAIEGVLKMPCSFTLFKNFVDQWCHADNFEPRQCDETDLVPGPGCNEFEQVS